MLPKPKTNALLEQINSYLAREQKPDEFTVRRWLREAESLSKSDPVEGRFLLSILAGIQDDIPAMREHFEKALVISPEDEYVSWNYAINLGKTGFIREAAEKMIQLSHLHQDNLKYLNHAIDAAVRSGLINKAIELVARWNKLNPKHEHPRRKVIDKVTTLLSKHGVTEEILKGIIAIPYTILHKHDIYFRFRFRKDTIEVRNDDDYEWLDYKITLPSSLSDEKIFELDEDLINAFSDSNLPAEALQYFSPMFSTEGYA